MPALPPPMMAAPRKNDQSASEISSAAPVSKLNARKTTRLPRSWMSMSRRDAAASPTR